MKGTKNTKAVKSPSEGSTLKELFDLIDALRKKATKDKEIDELLETAKERWDEKGRYAY